jgi:hypothetical protein
MTSGTHRSASAGERGAERRRPWAGWAERPSRLAAACAAGLRGQFCAGWAVARAATAGLAWDDGPKRGGDRVGKRKKASRILKRTQTKEFKL